MKKYIITLLTTVILISCKAPGILVTDLNTVGKIIKITKCDCVDGQYIYLVELNPEDKDCIKYITDTHYVLGEYIYFHTTIKKEDNR